VSLQVATGKAGEVNQLLEALARGREDDQFFSDFFLNRRLHDGQLEYVQNANATVNCLATANRWGKTTVLLHVHAKACVYKTGGEPKYAAGGEVDNTLFLTLKYNTIHTAGDFETAMLVWEDAHKIMGESPNFRALVRDAPRSKPPHIDFITGSRWKFRTLGHDASGIDGNSFYVVSIDEAGWIDGLEKMMGNVVRVRVADVRGVIHLVGTFKPGVSRDFYKFCVRAAAYTGKGITLDHRSADDGTDPLPVSSLDQAIRRYLRDYFRGRKIGKELQVDLFHLGIDRDELVDAVT
jgi:hypothetical protein